LTNAQKFTSRGQVILYAETLEHEVIIGVKDSGEGIAADKLNKLFQRYHQADDNFERRQQGSGLGLAICQELVEMHGGRIWVESTPGEGSNFRFTLPVGPPTAS
jgi:signal transduction histidine kinase